LGGGGKLNLMGGVFDLGGKLRGARGGDTYMGFGVLTGGFLTVT